MKNYLIWACIFLSTVNSIAISYLFYSFSKSGEQLNGASSPSQIFTEEKNAANSENIIPQISPETSRSDIEKLKSHQENKETRNFKESKVEKKKSPIPGIYEE